MADKTERPTQEEILKALQTIKEACENNLCGAGLGNKRRQTMESNSLKEV